MTGVARPPVRITSDPPRGSFSHGRAVATIQPDGAAHRTVVTLSLVEGQLSCRESFGAVARHLHEAAVRARALPPDDVPVWTSAYDLPAGSPGDPRSRKRLFRGS